MDDLKDIESESSYNSDILHMKPSEEVENFEGLPILNDEENRVDEANSASDLWESAKAGLETSETGAGIGTGTETGTDNSFMRKVPLSEQIFNGGADEPSLFQGPSAGADYQPMEDFEYRFKVAQATKTGLATTTSTSTAGDDRTVSLQQDPKTTPGIVTKTDVDKTLAVEGLAHARPSARRIPDSESKINMDLIRSHRPSGNVHTSMDASLAQAENLKVAQQRILDLEKEVEHLRIENEELASAGEVVRSRLDELGVRITEIEKEKAELRESAQSEILILKGTLQHKENEHAKARIKIEELEARLKSDFKKIRVRERELENRLELLRAEKTALVRSKDEYILEQKRKIDQLSQELDNYRTKCLELNKTIEANQDQVKRTERALRLALTNLEAKEENLVPLKKAE